MNRLKSLIGSWDLRDLIFVLAVALVATSYLVYLRLRSQPITMTDIGASIGIVLVFLLFIRLRKAAKKALPTPRVKYTISLPVAAIMTEFVHLGYRVEAMTEDTVVLVRFKLRLAILSAFLILPVTLLIVLSRETPEAQTQAGLLIAALSFLAVYMFNIAGYGYDRIAFHQQGDTDTSSCVIPINLPLPSRVWMRVVAKEDYGDHDWYRKYPEFL